MKKYLSKSYLVTYLIIAIAMCLMGLSVSCLTIACLGADPVTSLNMAASIRLNLTVGTCLTIFNVTLFIFNLIFNRKRVGVVTILFMLMIGPFADMWNYIIATIFGGYPLLTEGYYLIRMLVFALGVLLSTFGVSFILTANLGSPSYDALGYFIDRLSHNKLTFKYSRMILDSLAVLGSFLILMGTGRVLEVIGFGTIISSLFVGPILNFFINRVATPILDQVKKIK